MVPPYVGRHLPIWAHFFRTTRLPVLRGNMSRIDWRKTVMRGRHLGPMRLYCHFLGVPMYLEALPRLNLEALPRLLDLQTLPWLYLHTFHLVA